MEEQEEKISMMPAAKVSEKKFSLSKIVDLFRRKRKKDKKKAGKEDASQNH